LFLIICHKQFAFYITKPSFCVCKILLHIFINYTRVLNKLKAHNLKTQVSKPIDCFNQVKTLNFCSWSQKDTKSFKTKSLLQPS
jgi:hypothetical protein